MALWADCDSRFVRPPSHPTRPQPGWLWTVFANPMHGKAFNSTCPSPTHPTPLFDWLAQGSVAFPNLTSEPRFVMANAYLRWAAKGACLNKFPSCSIFCHLCLCCCCVLLREWVGKEEAGRERTDWCREGSLCSSAACSHLR